MRPSKSSVMIHPGEAGLLNKIDYSTNLSIWGGRWAVKDFCRDYLPWIPDSEQNSSTAFGKLLFVPRTGDKGSIAG